MGILFGKPKPESIYQELATKIVYAALQYRRDLNHPNHQLTCVAGTEFTYCLLHMLDRATFNILGASKRDTVFDEVLKRVIADYSRSVFVPSTPAAAVENLALQMFETMNERQDLYSHCKSLTDEVFPSRGTIIFALAYFIHLALGRTTRKDVEDVLRGEKNVTQENNDAFPDADEILKLAIYVNAFLGAAKLEDSIRDLR